MTQSTFGLSGDVRHTLLKTSGLHGKIGIIRSRGELNLQNQKLGVALEEAERTIIAEQRAELDRLIAKIAEHAARRETGDAEGVELGRQLKQERWKLTCRQVL